MAAFTYSNKINVVYANGMNDQIGPALLASLIKSRIIDHFERSDGWVEIGIDPVRGMGGKSYGGSDRRLN